ncbi:aldose epimerase family protein [Robbsia andropogonis]|uniref:aldose epimerase family protein n=1 Tax=Robbsia andropogonis TaxID=28092 RepID=UPI002A6A9427|nr:aldose epimerase family protein [Robbsia andropogonis]
MTTIACEARPWGTINGGTTVHQFTLRARNGARAVVSNLGATLLQWYAPDRNGDFDNIILGFATPQAYLDSSTHMGGTIGRYANRIADARFTLDGREYTLDTNDGTNTLHGGYHGFDRMVWEHAVSPAGDGVTFTLHSPDGDSGFPGALTLTVRYTFDGASVRIDYDAQTSAPTPFNVTNHSYFNLNTTGHPEDAGTILDYVVRIDADAVLLPDVHGIPQRQVPVAGSVFDLRDGAAVGARLATRDPALVAMHGYDHCYLLAAPDRIETPIRNVAEAIDPHSGRRLQVSTTERTVQFYTAANLGGVIDGRGRTLQPHAALCFETQAQPNQINTGDAAGVILRPGHTYRQTTVYRCDVVTANARKAIHN